MKEIADKTVIGTIMLSLPLIMITIMHYTKWIDDANLGIALMIILQIVMNASLVYYSIKKENEK